MGEKDGLFNEETGELQSNMAALSVDTKMRERAPAQVWAKVRARVWARARVSVRARARVWVKRKDFLMKRHIFLVC